jgi:hypothetical protein
MCAHSRIFSLNIIDPTQGMSDIKQVNINVPIPKVKKERKTRKMDKENKVNKPVTGGNPLPNPMPVQVSNPMPVQVSNPMPVLSTIRIGGNKSINNMAHNKPIININVPTNNAPSVNLPSAKKITPNSVKIVNSKKPAIRKIISEHPKLNIQPNKRRNFTLKRKFTSKNIIIQVENANEIKKSRENIEAKIKAMTEDEITKKLISRGLMRPTANPPLKWKQSMMADIMMFPTRL